MTVTDRATRLGTLVAHALPSLGPRCRALVRCVDSSGDALRLPTNFPSTRMCSRSAEQCLDVDLAPLPVVTPLRSAHRPTRRSLSLRIQICLPHPPLTALIQRSHLHHSLNRTRSEAIRLHDAALDDHDAARQPVAAPPVVDDHRPISAQQQQWQRHASLHEQ